MIELTPRQTYKALLFDYDWIMSLSDNGCLYCLTEKQAQMILTMVEYIGWRTRWVSLTNTEIDTQVLTELQGNLARAIMDNCCGDDHPIPPQYRYDGEGNLEVSFDGGETWQDGQVYDYREQVVQLPPVSAATTDEAKCKAAENIRSNMVATRDNAAENLATSTTIIGIVTGIANFLLAFLGLGVVAQTMLSILMGLGVFLWSLTPEDLLEAVGDTELDILKCLAYCYSDDDGRYTTEGFAGLRDQLSTDIADSTANYFFDTVLDALGAKGLGNLGALGNGVGDSCEECYCGDVTCGFSTTGATPTNQARWIIATDLVDTVAYFDQPIELVKDGTAAMKNTTNFRTLAAKVEFEEACYITSVSLYTLGRANTSYVTVAYKTSPAGSWINVGTQTYASWAGGVEKVFNINAPIYAVQVQSRAINAGQNNFSTININDPTP